MLHLGFPGSSAGKESIRSAGDPVQFLGWEAPLEKGYSLVFLGFPVAHAGDLGLIPELGRSPGEGNSWLPTPVFWPEEFHGVTKSWT